MLFVSRLEGISLLQGADEGSLSDAAGANDRDQFSHIDDAYL
jgi:hypothetical protein